MWVIIPVFRSSYFLQFQIDLFDTVMMARVMIMQLGRKGFCLTLGIFVIRLADKMCCSKLRSYNKLRALLFFLI